MSACTLFCVSTYRAFTGNEILTALVKFKLVINHVKKNK
ncbi:hypothetical protein PAE4_30484 [Bacillus altitudinis]|uniref:Uncharacterized protein n=1 Tax=Bacillus altitudinis TaxID=293387 RepID=A0A653QZT0_BACAB|nr:hypothetical protein PAE4_30484 [Bacillus altitudinis]VXB47527.1 hypothetical protein BACI348_40805 [Bacillus altitudinis]